MEFPNKNKELEDVTNEVREFEDLVKKLKMEVSELTTENIEKPTIITNLVNVEANPSIVMEKKNCSNFIETDLIKAEFTHLLSKYNELLGELREGYN